MRRIPLRFCVLSAILIAINVTGLVVIRQELVADRVSETRPARVVSALPANDVDATDRLSLVLDAPVARAEELQQPLSVSPVKIEPQPAGHWMWSEPNRLDFVLHEPLPAATEFKIKPVAGVDAQGGKAVQLDQEVVFKTRSLELEKCELQSADPHHVNFELKFNQRVDPGVLIRHLKVLDADASADSPTKTDASEAVEEPEHSEPSSAGTLRPTSLVKEPSETIVIRCDRPHGKRLKIVLDAALTGHDGDRPLGKTVTQTVDVSTVFSLLRAAVEEPGLEDDIRVLLHFTEDLDRRQAVPAVQVSPEVKNVSVRVCTVPYSEGTVLRLEGAFEPGKRYSATVGPTLLSESGKTLADSQSVSFEVPDRRPSICFLSGEGVLTPQGNLAIDLKSVNVSGLVFSASRVHANNIVAHLQGTYHEQTSRSLAERPIRLNPVRNVPSASALDLRGLLSEPLGIYHVRASATDHTWTSDSTLVTVTDLAVTVKRERQRVLVWITSLRTAKPVANVKVSTVSYNNQMLATARTSEDGTATLPVDEQHPDGVPWVILAEHEDGSKPPGDMAYLLIDQRPWVLDDIDQSGRPSPTTYDVMLYGERGVYRPGDTIHLTGIVRDAHGDVPPPFPLSVTVTRPDGRQVADVTVTPEANKQGVFHVEFPTRADGQTGPYVFKASLLGSDDVLGSGYVYVETFVPVRMEVQAEPKQKQFAPGQPPAVEVRARYLFGQPAAQLPVTANGSFRRVAFSSVKHPQFTFGDTRLTERVQIAVKDQTLDANGLTTMELTAPDVKPPGLWQGRLTTTVTEPGGRSVSATVTVSVDIAGRYVGLRIPAGNVVSAGQPVDMEWIQQKSDDEAAEPGPVDLTLLQVEYDTVLRRVRGDTFWKSVERTIPVWNGKTNDDTSAAAGSVKLTCPSAGKYRVLAVDCKSGSQTCVEFYAANQDTTHVAIGMNQPERLEIVLDKDAYVPGETAKVLVRSPFAGTMLLCLETDRAIEKRVVGMEQNTISLDLPIDASLRGGAYITASVVRAVNPEDATWLPHRARGMARLVTDHSKHQLPVSIHAPAQTKPGDKIEVVVTTRAPVQGQPAAVIHLWAVDEGILQASSFTTPDPMTHFLAQRKSEVSTADVFGDLLPDHKRPAGMTRIGADADRELDALRRSPVPTTRKEPAVVWRTVEPVDNDGRLKCEIELPKLTGAMRLMAVAVDRDDYGCAEQPVTLTAPLLVETAWPRFVAPQDSFAVPLKLFNSTGEPLQATLTLDTQGPLEVTLPESTVTVLPNEPLTVWLNAKATGIGQATVIAKATATSAKDGTVTGTSERNVSVRPSGGLHSVSQVLQVTAGQPLTIDVPAEFAPSGLERTVAISARPSVQLRPVIEQLIDYPHGCVEQTSSQLHAVLAAAEVLALEPNESSRQKAVGNVIDAGIARLWALQTPSGGLGYWPGASDADDWGTAYAGRALLEAKRQGHRVDQRFLAGLVAYLKSVLPQHASDPNRMAQLCRMLAEFGEPQIGWMARLSERLDRLDMEGRADLAAAWYRSGRKDRALAALPEDTMAQTVSSSTRGRLTSSVQQQAVLLGVLLEIDPHHKWIPALASNVMDARKDGTWGNTLENATAVSALARYQAATAEPADFRGTVKTGDGEAIPFTHEAPIVRRIPDSSAPIEVTSSGTGSIFVSVTTRGLLKEGSVTEYDRQLKVRRQWMDGRGKPIDVNSLKVGDLVHVEVLLQGLASRASQTIGNVAVVDALPGGMEIENPRLATSAVNSEQPDGGADHVEFLDDRVVLFASAGRKERTFRYALRVISAGSFVLPPIQASCMYNEGYASLNGGGKIQVTRCSGN